MANIRQVAKRAGVSPATVSRVLSGDPDFNVREETRRKINDAVAALQYEIPVREQHQYRFGCILSDTTDKYSDPFFVDILVAMENACKSRNATIAVVKSFKELDNPQILQEIIGAELDGIFLMEHISPEAMTALKTHIPHIIFIDKDEPEYDFDNVGFDHTTANWQVMTTLLDRGAGIKYEDALVKDCGWDLDLCKRQTQELMELPEPPDAIFAGSDSLASVVLGTLYELGFRCPRDVGVIGFNNIDLSSHMVPPLTTIEVPTSDIGKAAVERMLQIIKDKDTSIRRILFPTKLIERKSLK